MARTSNTMLNKCGEHGNSCLIPDLKAFSFSLLSMLAVHLSYMAFIMLKYFPSKSTLLSFFKCFFCVYWDDHMLFIPCFVNVMYHVDWFVGVKSSLHHWDQSTWSWYKIFLRYDWIWFANIRLRIFASVFIRDISL